MNLEAIILFQNLNKPTFLRLCFLFFFLNNISGIALWLVKKTLSRHPKVIDVCSNDPISKVVGGFILLVYQKHKGLAKANRR